MLLLRIWRRRGGVHQVCKDAGAGDQGLYSRLRGVLGEWPPARLGMGSEERGLAVDLDLDVDCGRNVVAERDTAEDAAVVHIS